MVSIGETSENYLSIKFKKSSDVNDLLLNTFRRVILSELYSFAFAPPEISIPTNTSILNNDHLRHRISLLPIQSFKEKHLPNTNITVSLVQENTDDIIKTVTTDHCIVRINNIITPNIFPSPPVIICNLKESQKLEFTALASYGKAITHNMYAAASNSYFEEFDNHYILYIESLGQYTCKEIYKKSIELFKDKITKLQKYILDQPESDSNYIEIKFENENHTFGAIFVHVLQQLKEIVFAGYKMEHPSINNLEITINTDGTKNVKKVVDIVIKKLHDIFNEMNIK